PGTYAYNWASRKGFIKNEAVAVLMCHDITVVSNAYADLSYAFLAPQAYTYYGIDIDGELSSYSDWNDTYDRNFPIIFGASASVGDHMIQAFVADENWNKTYLDSAVLHVVQGPTVNLSLNISDDSIVIYDQESVSFTYSASCQNANVRSLYAFFFDNQSGIAVHIEIDVPGVRVCSSVLDGGVRLASAEGAVLDNNIFFSGDNPLIDHWGPEYRYGVFGPVYTWKNTVLTNNIFYCEKNLKSFFIFDLPSYASFYDLFADSNRFFVKGGSAGEKSYRAIDAKEVNFREFISMIGDKNAEYLSKDPFTNNGTVTVRFCDKASVSDGYGAANCVPVELSKPMNEECNVYYRVWDYDSGTVLREGILHFDRFETRKSIDTDGYDCNILIEISGVQNVAPGENSFHFRKAA
ncbi:MAG: hypothetical protein II969_12020, partial [Anaerolineaceae bacterium]|nr:hypothetical protein [Anaerolineaceae bacterium]